MRSKDNLWTLKKQISDIKLDINTAPPGYKDVRVFLESLYVQRLYELDIARMRPYLSFLEKSRKQTLSPPLKQLHELYTEWVDKVNEYHGPTPSAQHLTVEELCRELKQMGVKVKRSREQNVILEDWIRIETPYMREIL